MRKGILVVACMAMLVLGWGMLSHRTVMPPETRTEPAESALEFAPEMSAPRPKAASMPEALPSETLPPTNRLAELMKKPPELRLEQLAQYLQANHRDAGSLLAAYQATHERALLDEARTNFPSDPRVAYTAWFRSEPTAGDPDALTARRQALDAFKQADPDNALANYLSAANYFKSGQPDLALQEMQAAASKSKLDDYGRESIQDRTEAYEAAGYSEAEAKLVAVTGTLLPHLAEMKQAGLSLIELGSSYRQAGDTAAAQASLQMCLDLGQRLDDPNALTVIQNLVGIAVQTRGLDAMIASAPDASTTEALQKQKDELVQQRNGIKALVAANPYDQCIQNASSQDVIGYIDRMQAAGEQKALRWLANRYPSQ